jgi:hypothetical protein
MKTKSLWLVALLLLCAVAWTIYAQKQADTRPAWEYMSMTVPDYASASRLNKAGEEGWELVAVTQPEGANTTKSYFFKRAK